MNFYYSWVIIDKRNIALNVIKYTLSKQNIVMFVNRAWSDMITIVFLLIIVLEVVIRWNSFYLFYYL